MGSGVPKTGRRPPFGDFMNNFGGLGGIGGGGQSEEIQNLTKKLQELDLPEETRKIIDQEVQKI